MKGAISAPFSPLDDHIKNSSEKDHRIFFELMRRNNPLDPEKGISEAAATHHLNQIRKMIVAGEPISMILPAFPGKSPNRRKTLSYMPDLAERLALDELAGLCRSIEDIYPPGAVVEICSDGYVFSDLVQIPDNRVTEYTDELKRWTSELYPDFFAYFDLKDAYPQLTDLARMREVLTQQHGEAIDSISAQAREDAGARSMYLGITRFLFEDYRGMREFSGFSNTAIQKRARATAYQVIQRSNAWSALLEARRPDAVRLSIHPQGENSKKFGIRLVPCVDIWRTPWHSVAVKRDGQIFLERRSDVEAEACRLMFRNGRPCHYVYS
ncbi:isocyanide synthase family protein [Breoghania sp. JC706]|uniref:isocyanide synthase family protein n=1 Tax=Breoghania sp. JC706 TaxID=3117732 RepID=UPI003008F507